MGISALEEKQNKTKQSMKRVQKVLCKGVILKLVVRKSLSEVV